MRACGLTLTATLVAAALAASGSAAPELRSACSNGSYLQSWRAADKLFKTAVSQINAVRLVSAALSIQGAQRKVQSAPLPCNSKLLLARTYALREYANTLLALRAADDGDYLTSGVHLRQALHEQDLVASLIGSYGGSAGHG